MKANKENLYKHVDFLTSLDSVRNYQNLESLERVCDYIKAELKTYGAASTEQKWVAANSEYKNIIASYNTGDKKRLVIGAHYDVDGDQPGADDNASGVAGLLETTRLCFTKMPELDFQVDFVFYCLEEAPFFSTELMGSYIHAKSLYDSGTDVIGMICYDMIGFFSDEPESQSFPSPELGAIYPHTANFIMVIGIEKYAAFNNQFHALMSNKSEIDVQVISFPERHAQASLAGLSDHRNYWKFNYPAFMINDTAFVRNLNYHRSSDTIDTLNFTRMAMVVDSTYSAVINMHTI